MLRAIANLRIAAKLALPLALVALTAGGIVWQARSSLERLAATTQSLVDRSATRVADVLTIEAMIDEATVQEGDMILDTNMAQTGRLRSMHKDAINAARRKADRLVALSDTPQRLKASQEIRAALDEFAKDSDKVVSLAAAGQFDNAYALASGAGSAARMQLTGLVQAHVDASLHEMATAKQDAAALAQRTGRDLLLLSAVGLLVSFGLLALMVRVTVTLPLARITASMSRLAAGDLDIAVAGAERRDELGSLARSLGVFKDNAEAARRAEAEAEAQRHRAGEAAREALARVAAEFEAGAGEVVNTVATAATEMQGAAASMSGTADAASQQAAAVAAAAGEATGNVNNVAAAAEELAASIGEIARQVSQSSQIASGAVQEAARANASVQGLAQAAQSIGEVVQMIQGIAGQTNLLALNATIEAARAGEAGKGFAVVASEVKSLAGQTARATEEIRAQIGGVQQTTQEVVGAIGSIGATIEQISGIATAIAAAVEQQGAATAEIAGGLSRAARGTGAVSETIVGVTQAAGEVGAASSQVLAAASDLARQAETLRAQVGRFLDNVRQAA